MLSHHLFPNLDGLSENTKISEQNNTFAFLAHIILCSNPIYKTIVNIHFVGIIEKWLNLEWFSNFEDMSCYSKKQNQTHHHHHQQKKNS